MRRFTIKHPRLVMLGVNLFSGVLVAILLMVCLAYNLSWLCFLFMLLMMLVFTYLPLAVGRWVDDFVEYSKVYNPKTYFQAAINNCTINIEEDLRFRLFFNAPEGYDWGVVDTNGIGRVYDMDPLHDSIEVGRFDQYKDVCNYPIARVKK